jgi:hypothetical protein
MLPALFDHRKVGCTVDPEIKQATEKTQKQPAPLRLTSIVYQACWCLHDDGHACIPLKTLDLYCTSLKT